MRFGSNKTKRYAYGNLLILLLGLLSLTAILSCTSSTGSSSGTGSSAGSGWTMSVSTSGSSVSAGRLEIVQVIAIVRDRNGTPAVKATSVCLSAVRGGFLVTDSSGSTKVFASMCNATTNDNGQSQATYIPAVTGTDATGATVQIPISPGADTITASAMGVFGSTSINVTP